MSWLDNVWQDLRHGARLLIKNPGFTAIAVLSIAFGTGANVAMFSSTDALLLRPLPIRHAEGLFTVGMAVTLGPVGETQMSYADFDDVRRRSRTMQSWVAYDTQKSAVGLTSESQRVRLVTAVSGNFFDELGVPILLGRGFTPEEDRVPGRDAVTVLSHGLWQGLFNGDPHVVGRQMSIGNHWFTVVGVTDKSYTGMYPRDIPNESFVPLAMEREVFRIAGRDPRADRLLRSATVKARLRPGVSLDDARAEMRLIAGELARAYPGTNKGQDIIVQTEFQARVSSGELEAGVLLVLTILAVAVLCVACANVAGLLTSRAPLRQRELAVRLAVGAGRGRLIAQLLTESLLLAILGGLGGIAVGAAGIRLLRGIELPTDLIGPPVFVMDNRALGFSIAVAVLSALMFGLGPALSTTRIDLSYSMRGTEAARRRRWMPGGRSSLTAVQVALSLMLLTIAAISYQTFAETFGRGPGFRTTNMAKISVNAAQRGYEGPRATEFFDQIVTSTRQLPGVRSAAVTSAKPLFGIELMPVVFDASKTTGAADGVTIFANVVSEDYFEAMGMGLLEGRAFQTTDRSDAPEVIVINDTMARHFWPGRSAVGQRVRLRDAGGPAAEVVGVVQTTMYLYPTEKPQDMVYMSFRQHARGDMVVLAHTAAASSAPLNGMRRIVRGLDAAVPVYDAQTIEGFYRARATGPGDIVMTLVGAIGVMGLTITLVGLYGLVSYAVNRRTREIGIRIAIGATYGRLLGMLLRQGLAPAWVGIVAGVILSVVTARLIVTVVETTATMRPVIMLIIVPVLVTVTLLAAFVPARRAANTDPAVALRYE
jgi:putative ABC transport system permease protein